MLKTITAITLLSFHLSPVLADGDESQPGATRKLKPIDTQIAQGIRSVCFYAMIFAALYYIYAWYEKRKEKEQKDQKRMSLREMRESMISHFSDAIVEVKLEDGPNPRLDGHPLYTTGGLNITGPAQDAKFNMIAEGHPIIQRKVEVCCWEEDQVPRASRKGDTV